MKVSEFRPGDKEISAGREEIGGFEEPAVIAEEDAGIGMLVGDEADGDAFPELLDLLAVMGIAFPDEGISEQYAGEEVARAVAAFEKRFEFEAIQRKGDEIIEADALADEDPEVGFGEVFERDFAEVEAGGKGKEVPERVAEFFAFELEEVLVGIKVARLWFVLRRWG